MESENIDVSIIIPSRNEQFLARTVQDLVEKARTKIEIIIVLEGYWPEDIDQSTEDLLYPQVSIIHHSTPKGMRGAINAGAALAHGKYLMKCDAHCMFDEGFDEKLIADLEENWIAVPTRYSLDPENWERRQKKPTEYMFLCAPTDPNDFGGPSLHGKVWAEKQNDPNLKDILIDDLMSAQGSCWFMHHSYFYELELLDDINYGHFCFEFQEIGLKCWLSGGRVIRNKKTWYAHLHKGRKYGRGWPLGSSTLRKGAAYCNLWMRDQLWHKQDRDIRWLIQKFWPVPTWTPESTYLVFHRRRGGSGEIRGSQIADYLLARCNPKWVYDQDTHIYVKMRPPEDYPRGRSYLDVLDAQERVSWLMKHPDIGVIASSQTGQEYLQAKLGRSDIHLIPQHHCNYERLSRQDRPVHTIGVIGGRGALQCDVEELKRRLEAEGLDFRWMQRYTTRQDVVNFYSELDVQVIWRKQQRPLKNPMKLYNAASFGIPTVGYPEIGYREWPHLREVTSLDDLIGAVLDYRDNGWDAQMLIDAAEPYHIENIAPLYRRLL